MQAYNAGMTAGHSLTVSGMSFGSLDTTPSVDMGLTSCKTAAWGSSTSVRCLVAAGSRPSILAGCTVHSVTGTGLGLFSFDGFFTFLQAQCKDFFTFPQAQCKAGLDFTGCASKGSLLSTLLSQQLLYTSAHQAVLDTATTAKHLR